MVDDSVYTIEELLSMTVPLLERLLERVRILEETVNKLMTEVTSHIRVSDKKELMDDKVDEMIKEQTQKELDSFKNELTSIRETLNNVNKTDEEKIHTIENKLIEIDKTIVQITTHLNIIVGAEKEELESRKWYRSLVDKFFSLLTTTKGWLIIITFCVITMFTFGVPTNVIEGILAKLNIIDEITDERIDRITNSLKQISVNEKIHKKYIDAIITKYRNIVEVSEDMLPFDYPVRKDSFFYIWLPKSSRIGSIILIRNGEETDVKYQIIRDTNG